MNMRILFFLSFALLISRVKGQESSCRTYYPTYLENSKIGRDLSELLKWNFYNGTPFYYCLNCAEEDFIKSVYISNQMHHDHSDRSIYIIDGVPVENMGEWGYEGTQIGTRENVYPIEPLPLKTTLGKYDFELIPHTEIRDIAATLPSIFQKRRGAELSIRGAGEYGTLYVVDHMIIMR